MTAIQVTALIVAACAGTGVVFAADALRQTLVLGIYGLVLTVLFFVFQAPDVALSEVVVSGIAVPVIVLAALRQIRQQERTRREKDEP